MKILVADDNAISREFLKGLLEKEGYQVVFAENGESALQELFSHDPPRIAILDWSMPKLEGVEVCRQLQIYGAQKFIFMILLTTKSGPENLVQALEAGAHDFQTKPIEPNELTARLRVACKLIAANDQIHEYAVQMEQLAKHRAQQLLQAEHEARMDSLTNLPNRRYFFELARKEFNRAKRYRRPLSCLMFDIDFFKKINDTYGHQAGDDALKQLAQTARGLLREENHIGRIGGEEFAAILPESDLQSAFTVADRLRHTLSRLSIPAQSEFFSCTVSIGITGLLPTDRSPEMMFARADKALYKAKKAGRNQSQVELAQ